MLCGASSSAADFAKPRTAHFDAVYPWDQTLPRRPAIDETFMIDHHRRQSSVRPQHECPKNIPVRLLSMMRRQSSRRNFWIGAPLIPALLTIRSVCRIRPSRSHRDLPLVGVGDVEMGIACRTPDLTGKLLADIVENVADHRLARPPRQGGAHARRPYRALLQ